MSKIILYTATQNRLLARNKKWDSVEMVCFSENKPTAPWQWTPLKIISEDPCRNAKYPKIVPWDFFNETYPDWQFCIWIDANFQLLKHPMYFKNFDFAAHKHSKRNCIFQEVQQCIKLKKDDDSILLNQKFAYRDHPENFGLWECGMIVRKNTSENEQFCRDWWEEINQYSRRDQISLPIVAKQYNKQIQSLGNNIRKSRWAKIHYI